MRTGSAAPWADLAYAARSRKEDGLPPVTVLDERTGSAFLKVGNVRTRIAPRQRIDEEYRGIHVD